MNSNHADMDDQAEFGVAYNSDRVKMTDTEIDRAVKQREEIESWHLPHMARLLGVCGGNCEQVRRCDCAPNPAEACTDLGANQPAKRRLGPCGPLHRLVLAKRPTYTVAAITLLSIVCAVIWAIR